MAARDARGAIALNDQYVTLEIADSAHSGGRAPCNSYTASVAGGVGAVFVRLRVTRADRCSGAIDNGLDSRYFRALSATTNASLAGGSLLLRSARTTLRFVRSVRPPLLDIIGDSWQLQSLSGFVDYISIDQPWFNLSVQDAHLFEFGTPCGFIVFHYRVTGRNLVTVSAAERTPADWSRCGSLRAISENAAATLSGQFRLRFTKNALVVSSLNNGLVATFRPLVFAG